MTGCKAVVFHKGQEVIGKGAPVKSLFQVMKGLVSISKVEKGQKRVVEIAKEGSLLGEVDFLLEAEVSTNEYLAISESVELYEIEIAYLQILFFRKPTLASKFFRFVSSVLSEKLSNFVSNTVASPDPLQIIESNLSPQQQENQQKEKDLSPEV